MKQGKKRNKKSFLKSKKSLVAAAMAALIALAGVTYAWFTWSVGLTGGTLKADYVQIDAEFGAWIPLEDIFDYAWFFEGDQPTTKYVPQANISSVKFEGKVGAEAINGEVFIPFEYFQPVDNNGDATKVDQLINYLGSINYTPVLADTLAPNGYWDWNQKDFTVLEILQGAFVETAQGNIHPFFPMTESFPLPAPPADLVDATYTFAATADIFTDANALIGAKVINNWFQHELPQSGYGDHKVYVGYNIKNLGAACYINIPDFQKDLKVSQATAEYAAFYDAGQRYLANDDFVQPRWGVAQWGNYVYGVDAADTTAQLRGWHNGGVTEGTYSNGFFQTPDAGYYAEYATDATVNVPVQHGLGAIVEALGDAALGLPSIYGVDDELGADTWAGFDLFYQNNPGFKFPVAVINAAYAASAAPLYDGLNDIYPLSVDTPWLFGDDVQSDWEITIESASPVPVVGSTVYTDGLGLATAVANAVGGPYYFDLGLYTSTQAYALAGANAITVTTPPARTALSNAFTAFVAGTPLPATIAGLNPAVWTGLSQANKELLAAYCWLAANNPAVDDPANAVGAVPVDFIPQEHLAVVTKVDGNNTFKVLDVQGAAFTYKTLQTAPSINVKYLVKLGKYLDNRFVGCQLYFDSPGMVAVQHTPAAAYDVYIDKATQKYGFADFAAFDVFLNGPKTLVPIKDVAGLPTQYVDLITP